MRISKEGKAMRIKRALLLPVITIAAVLLGVGVSALPASAATISGNYQGFVKVAGGVQPGESPVRSRNCRARRGSCAQ